MVHFRPGLPPTNEYSPAFAGYVAKAQSFADPIEALETQLGEVLSLLKTLPESKQLYRYAPGKWSVKDMLGHMIDAERIFAYRALRIARADQTPLPGFDESSYATASEIDRCNWQELLEEFQYVRRSSILMLNHFPEAAWTRVGMTNRTPVSVRALAYIMVGHVAHHMAILNERYLSQVAAAPVAP